MAQLDVHAAGDHGPPWQAQHHAYTSAWPPRGDAADMGNNAYHDYHDYQDWTAVPLSPHRPAATPRHGRRGDVHKPAHSTFTAAPPSTAGSRRHRPPTVGRAASMVFPSPPASLRHPTSAVAAAAAMGLPPRIPSLQRAFTAPTEKPAKASAKASVKSSGKSSGSRRTASRLSRHHPRRSTPESRETLRSSLSDDSDGGDDGATHVTRPMPEDEDEQDTSTLYGKERTKRGSHRPVRHRRSNSSNSKRGRPLRNRIPEEAPAVPEVEPEEEDEDEDEDSEDDEDNDEDDYDDEEEHGRVRRRTKSRHSRRSASRHTTATRDYYLLARSVAARSKSRPRAPDGEDDAFNPRVPSKQRAATGGRYCASELPATFAYDRRHETGYKRGYDHTRKPLVLRGAETQPTLPSQAAGWYGGGVGHPRRAASLFETPLAYGSPARSSEKSPKRTACAICRDEAPPSRVVKLACGHRMCTPCLKRKFQTSMSDADQMPPRCCTLLAIPPRHAAPLFDAGFQRAWNDAFRAHATARRIYCPSRHCQEWIKPEPPAALARDPDGEPVVRCGRCRTRVCLRCHGKWHAPQACRYDEAAAQRLGAVRAAGRQRCCKCKAPVERMAGQNRMICRCGAESCMICGGKWNHCACPVFAVDGNDGDAGHAPRGGSGRSDRFGRGGRAGLVGDVPAAAASYATHDPARMRPRSYEDEMSRLRQRTGGAAGGADHLTRRMQSLRGLEDVEAMDNVYEEVDSPYYRADSTARRDVRSYAEGAGVDEPGAGADGDDGDGSLVTRRPPPPRRRRSFVVADEEGYRPRYAATDILPAVPQPPSPPSPPPPALTPPALSGMAPAPTPPPPFPGMHYRRQQSPHHASYATPPFDRTLSGGGDFYMSNLARARGGHADYDTGRLADRFNAGPRPPGAGVAAMAPLPAMGPLPHMPSMQSMQSMPPMPPMPPMRSMPGTFPPPPPPPPPAMGGLAMMPMVPGVAVPGGSPYGGLEAHGPMYAPYEDAYDEEAYEGYDNPYEDAAEMHEMRMPEGGGSSGHRGRRRQRRRDMEAAAAAAAAEAEESQPAHVLAGLAGPGRGIMERVPSWLAYVDAGLPEERADY